jgi:hypothetical protein
MKHGNKHWEREKEYISLLKEYEYLHTTISVYHWCRNREVDRVRKKLRYKYYNEYYGMYNTAPKWYRKMKNKIQRAKSKQTLYRELQGYDVCYEDNYKDCAWYW